MRRSELTILLPPAELKNNGEIVSRVYPLTITGTVHTPYVIVEDIHISPGNGVLDIRMTGEGVFDRRHTIGVSNTALPQAAATEMQPLEIRLLNLNPDAAVYVVIVVSTVEAVGSGPPVTFGGAVRFRGTLPLGTDGKPPVDMNDRAGNKSVIADGPLWSAVLTVNDTFEVRNIRDITSQVRVLAPTGTGRIPVTGGGRRVIIVKKDGVTMEVEADTLDFRNIFELDLPASGTVSILGLLAESIAGDVIQNGAIKSVHIEPGAIITNRLADNAVTPAKLDRSYSELGHTHDNRYYTEAEVNSLLAGKSNVGHTHPVSDITGSISLAGRASSTVHRVIDIPDGTWFTLPSTGSIWGFQGSPFTYLITGGIAVYGTNGTTANFNVEISYAGDTRVLGPFQADQGVDSVVPFTIAPSIVNNGVTTDPIPVQIRIQILSGVLAVRNWQWSGINIRR